MKNNDFTSYNYTLNSNAKQLRREMTKQEKHLWYDFLQSYEVKFYKQRPIRGYIADFYCSKAKLIVELDGSQHFTEGGLEYDEARTNIIEKLGLKVKRYTNLQVDRQFEAVCTDIDNEVKERLEKLRGE